MIELSGFILMEEKFKSQIQSHLRDNSVLDYP